MPFADHAAKIIKIEGGLVDNPKDPGGLTKYGISHRAHPELTRQQIIDLTPEDAIKIYKETYWAGIKGDLIEKYDDRLALIMLDMSVHSYWTASVKTLQAVLFNLGRNAVKIDGIIGPITLASLKRCDADLVCRKFLAKRMIFLSALTIWPDNKNGWIDRLFSL